MAEIEQLTRQNQRTFILVCSNFVMLLILFFGFGYVVWQSISLISKVKEDLARAEQAVTQLQEKVQTMNMDDLLNRVMVSAKESMGESIKTAISESEFSGSLGTLAGRVDNVQAKLASISESLKSLNDKLQWLNAERLARQVSYNMLLGLGQGLTSAAEANKPKPAPDIEKKSSEP